MAKQFPDNGDRQNVVLPDFGLVFMCVGKCASSSLKEVASLVDARSFKCTKQEVVSIHNRKMKVAVIRNPFERAVSIWWDKTQRGTLYQGFRLIPRMRQHISFRQFARVLVEVHDEHSLVDGHFRSQTSLLLDNEGDPIPDTIIPFEQLESGWAQLAELFGFSRKLPHKNDHFTGDAFTFYEQDPTSEARNLIETRYMDDLMAFYNWCLNMGSTAGDPRGLMRLREPAALSSQVDRHVRILPTVQRTTPEDGSEGAGVIQAPPAPSHPLDEEIEAPLDD